MPYRNCIALYRYFAAPHCIALSHCRAFKKITLNLRTGTALLFLHCTHSHRHMLPIKNCDSLCAFAAALPYRRTKITLNLHTGTVMLPCRGVISLHCNSNTADKNYAFIIASTAPTNENAIRLAPLSPRHAAHRIAPAPYN